MNLNPAEHIINLDLPASERWKCLINYKTEINELVEYYLNDIDNLIIKDIQQLITELIPQHYFEEMAFISSISKFSLDQIIIANLYYDILNSHFGCTAFAVDIGCTVLHGRNLDWHTSNNILSETTKLFNFQKGGKTIFKSVGWPGFIGVLSGVKPGAFSLSLNSAFSYDNNEIGIPISFLLREVLNSSESFEEAKIILEQTKIACDCLILLSGIKENEKIVIERTSTRFSTRETYKKYIAVTNDYRLLQNNSSDNNFLQSTSCDRYDRTVELLNESSPETVDDCANILTDNQVKMDITVQQMIFDNKTGEVKIL